MKLTRTTFLMGALGLGLAPKVRAQSDIVFDLLPVGTPNSFVSGNGRITWGGSGATLTRWELGGGVTSFATVLSAGSTVNGISRSGDAVAIGGSVWQESTGLVALGFPTGASSVTAAGVSRDLKTVFGTASIGGVGVPYYWSEGEPVEIGNLPEYQTGAVVDGSKTGGYATGHCGNQWNYQGFRFSPSGLDSIEFPEGFIHTLPQAISDDGKTIVGIAYGANWSPVKAFVWREGQGNTLLDPLASTAHDVSEDGSVIVGEAAFPDSEYLWNTTLGLTSLRSYLSAQNVNLKGATSLRNLRLSADGTTIIGRTTKDGTSRTFRARHPLGWQSAA